MLSFLWSSLPLSSRRCVLLRGMVRCYAYSLFRQSCVSRKCLFGPSFVFSIFCFCGSVVLLKMAPMLIRECKENFVWPHELVVRATFHSPTEFSQNRGLFASQPHSILRGGSRAGLADGAGTTKTRFISSWPGSFLRGQAPSTSSCSHGLVRYFLVSQ